MVIRGFDDDTIAAIATAPGEGGIGIVRLSGRSALEIGDRIFRAKTGTPVSRQKSFAARYGHVVRESDCSSRAVDEAIALVMRAPKSYTCEDVLEIHAHGGSAVLREVLDLALRAGARLAEPGEFTKRAFLNGRLDLLQAEAVIDLIRSKTALARRWASSQLEGALSSRVREIRDALVSALARLEASIDFPEDAPEADAPPEVVRELESAAAILAELTAGAEWGKLLRRGLSAAIVGRPNVGKSSLLNALAGEDRAIVTPHAGTTRDVVEAEIQVGGFPLRLSDTAGLRETDHPVEREGIARSKRAASGAEILLCVFDASRPLEPEDRAFFDSYADRERIAVLNKADLGMKIDSAALTGPGVRAVVACSTLHPDGIKVLEEEIYRFVVGGEAEIPEDAVVSSVRQKEHLDRTAASVREALASCRAGLSPELTAVDVRVGLDHLGLLVGEVVTDDVLDALFGRFCIGK